MTDSDGNDRETIVEKIRRKAEKKKRARERKQSDRGIWFGLGMYGLVGWSVSVPILLGLSIGIWLDRVTNGDFSWTLALLGAGVAAGCFNAWYWISHESEKDESDSSTE
jgi:ATP synthase protein I